MTKLQIPSYPERNFGGNQLLDSSMSLAPLCPGLTNDLHVSTATDLHQDFSWLHPAQVKLTIFRVPLNVLDLTSLSDDQERAVLHPSRTRVRTTLFQFALNGKASGLTPQHSHIR